MILDETRAHLDLKSREFLLETIDDLVKHKDSSVIIFVTQRIEDITSSFDKGLA